MLVGYDWFVVMSSGSILMITKVPIQVQRFVFKSLSYSIALVCTSSIAAVDVSDSNTASFNFGGTIAAMCKIKSSDTAGASNIALAQSNAAQDIGTVEVWCNTGRNATTEYASANNGFLVSGSEKIAYTLNVADNASNIDLASDYINNDSQAGSDISGTTHTQKLQITPQANGLESAGDYSDTITVTVTYN